MKPTLKEQVMQTAKEQGFNSITDFINAWIQSGETFKSLHDWLQLETGIERQDKTKVWKTFRDFLTIPYGYDDQLRYRWEAIAKIKGFKDIDHMVQTLKNRKLCLREMAEELGTSYHRAGNLLKRLSLCKFSSQKGGQKRRYIRHSHLLPSKDRDGITSKKCRDHWRNKLAEYGFRSLKDAIQRLKRKKLTYGQMAQLFGVTYRDFLYRRRRAGL